jgi:hypothetical protein
MHPFPPRSALQFLIGKELEQICLGYWQFQFRFEVGSISVQGALEHIDSAGVVRCHNTDEDRLSPIFVHHLLGQKVCLVSVEPFCLTLSFDRGDVLRIHSDNGPFECGTIDNELGLLAVF